MSKKDRIDYVAKYYGLEFNKLQKIILNKPNNISIGEIV
jgi:hypothetical protein